MILIRSATIDISPTSPLPLAGFTDRRRALYTRINDPLELNAISLEIDRQKVVVLSFDTLSVGSHLDMMARRLFGDTCISLATHTHFAPPLDVELPNLGLVNNAYLKHVEERLEELKAQLDDQEPVVASFSLGHIDVPLTVNRRRRAFGPDGRFKMRMLPNPSGPKNETATVLLLSDADRAKPIAVFWSFACHPVSFYESNAVSSEFCGKVRQEFRGRYGAALPCIFAQGFCGDVRPPAYGIGKTSARHILRYGIKRLLQGKCFGNFTEREWTSWSNAVAKIVVSAKLEQVEIEPDLNVVRAELPLADMHETPIADVGHRKGLDCAFVQLGKTIDIWAISGEPITEIAELLPRTDAVRIVAGYMGHVFGYLPTSAALAEGGYEADEFRPAFSLAGVYTTKISDVLADFFDDVWRARLNRRSIQ